MANGGGMEWIRKAYGRPAKRGGRVRYLSATGPVLGTIRSARYGRLMIQLDGDKASVPFHPTWNLEYLEDAHG